MKIGFIGLGRMGYAMVQLLVDKGHEVVAYDINADAVNSVTEYGAAGVNSLGELVEQLDQQRFVWIMVQRKVVQTVLDELTPQLSEGDVVIDGGNTFFKETLARAEKAAEQGLHYMDVGVSGGVEAARNGACLMIGGDRAVFETFEPVLKDLAQEDGYGYMGKTGAGHLVKGLHNGIEYGMMQAIGDGIEAIVDKSDEFDIDLKNVLRVYNHGSIVESKLTQWLEKAWQEDEMLSEIAGSVPTGDTHDEMLELSEMSDNPTLKLAIAERLRSQESPRFAAKAVAAMRNQFGGHATKKAEK